MVQRIRGFVLRDDRGVALVVVLLFAVLLMMLVATMLSVGGTQVSISGTQRDSARALELAQAGVEEGIRRVEAARPYRNPSPFAGSVDPSAVEVEVAAVRAGPSAQIIEIRGNARLGVARRRLNLLALAVPRMILPNIVFCSNFTEQGNAASIGSGDVYCETFVRFTSAPSAASLTYSGWWVDKANPNPLPQCYTHLQCVTEANLNVQPARRCTGGNPDPRCKWFPGQRLSVYATDPVAVDILANTNQSTCTVTAQTANGIKAEDSTGTSGPIQLYGFDRDDTWVPLAGPPTAVQAVVPPQAVTGSRPCGLPYKYVRKDFPDETGTPQTRYFKTLIYEEWLDNYWRLDQNSLAYVKRDGSVCTTPQPCLPLTGREPNLATYPDFGAVPPFVPFSQLTDNYDTYRSGGGTINDSSGIDLGYCANPNSCSAASSRPQIILLDNGDYTINGNLTGHGLILIDGNLTVNGTLTYWGTIIVNGSMTLGSGNVVVYGGVMAKSTAYLTGNITINAGGNVSNVLLGPATVYPRSWRER